MCCRRRVGADRAKLLWLVSSPGRRSTWMPPECRKLIGRRRHRHHHWLLRWSLVGFLSHRKRGRTRVQRCLSLCIGAERSGRLRLRLSTACWRSVFCVAWVWRGHSGASCNCCVGVGAGRSVCLRLRLSTTRWGRSCVSALWRHWRGGTGCRRRIGADRAELLRRVSSYGRQIA